MPMFKVRGADAVVRHDGKDYFEGDQIELTPDAAFANRHLLESVDDNPEFKQMVESQSGDRALRRSALEARRAELQKQVDEISRELANMDRQSRAEKSSESNRNQGVPVMTDSLETAGLAVSAPGTTPEARPVFPGPPTGGSTAPGVVGATPAASQGTTERPAPASDKV